MKTIYKYPVEVIDESFQLVLPIESEILTLQMQRDIPSLWIRQYPYNPGQIQELHTYKWFGTGYTEIPDNATYIGTVQFSDYVFHLFKI